MFSITRRRLGGLALSGALAAGTMMSGTVMASAADTINVGLLSLTSHSPSIIAEARGYFADQDLDVEFVSFQAAQPMAVAIASGDVDFGVTAISGGLVSLAEKGVIKIIGGALQEYPDIDGQKILVSKAAHDDGVTTPADLKGRTYGITTTGSSFHYMAHKIADKEGFDRAELHLKPMQKVPAVIASLKSGQIDAWSIVPNIAGALTKGGEVVEIGKVADYIDNYQVTTVFTSTANAGDKPDLVKRFLAGFAKGVDDYNAALVDKTMSEEETAEIVAMIHEYVYADQPLEKADPRIRAGAMRINANAKLNLESVRDQLEWFKSEGLVPETASMDNLVDASFVETF
ncbi:ABC transporter substrate-binding protein [Mesorhizobium xinjiangense]|uniref:ABC transporter substrate-binding protein n=1 Tax=Mesorhizobium xinjiangense TaxID=2678685 RepID=UPI0012EE80EB|nr:ABC transporter substrate-binding protein [Mesorhizobium xinjiangense]